MPKTFFHDYKSNERYRFVGMDGAWTSNIYTTTNYYYYAFMLSDKHKQDRHAHVMYRSYYIRGYNFAFDFVSVDVFF